MFSSLSKFIVAKQYEYKTPEELNATKLFLSKEISIYKYCYYDINTDKRLYEKKNDEDCKDVIKRINAEYNFLLGIENIKKNISITSFSSEELDEKIISLIKNFINETTSGITFNDTIFFDTIELYKKLDKKTTNIIIIVFLDNIIKYNYYKRNSKLSLYLKLNSITNDLFDSNIKKLMASSPGIIIDYHLENEPTTLLPYIKYIRDNCLINIKSFEGKISYKNILNELYLMHIKTLRPKEIIDYIKLKYKYIIPDYHKKYIDLFFEINSNFIIRDIKLLLIVKDEIINRDIKLIYELSEYFPSYSIDELYDYYFDSLIKTKIFTKKELDEYIILSKNKISREHL